MNLTEIEIQASRGNGPDYATVLAMTSLVRKQEAELDELGQEVARLQNALCFWLPSITAQEGEVAERLLNDALLLVGIDGNLPADFKSAQELGWVALCGEHKEAELAEARRVPVASRTEIARAIWNLRRIDTGDEPYDLEEMQAVHPVWAEADAVVAVLAAAQPTPATGKEPLQVAPAAAAQEPYGWLQYIDGVKTQNFARDESELATVKDIFRVMGRTGNAVYLPLYAAPVAPAPAQQDSERDAARWRAFVGSARIKMQGCAGLNAPLPNNYAHMGLEIWTTFGRDYSQELLDRMDSDNEIGRDWLTKYADIAVAAMSAPQSGSAK